MAKRKKKVEAEDTGNLGPVVMGIADDNPDQDLEYHADQLLHHAAKRSRGYKQARTALIRTAKRTASAKGFKPGATKF